MSSLLRRTSTQVMLPVGAKAHSSSLTKLLALSNSKYLLQPCHKFYHSSVTRPHNPNSSTTSIRTQSRNVDISSYAPGKHARLPMLQSAYFSTNKLLSQASPTPQPPSQPPASNGATNSSTSSSSISQTTETDAQPQVHAGFHRSEKAARAAQVNLRARLTKETKAVGGRAEWKEVVRLLRIAKPELPQLLVACVFLVVSSAVTMSLPWSVGQILDTMGKEDAGDVRILGMTLTQFFLGLGAFFTAGAASNFFRITLLRTIGERIVARLRTRLYRKTLTQDAEFFDANRVGDLISRLGSDCVIVGKSITQNLSVGLRALVSGAAGFTAMIWLSPKLSTVLLIASPPLAIGALFYGTAIRNISKMLQKNLGTLSKIAEERLGNIKTSQAFVGEIQEVRRYSNQVRNIYTLGRREATVAATFYATTGWVGNMAIGALLIVGGNLVRKGDMSIGDLTSFMMYTAFAGNSLFGLSSFYSELMKGVGAASRLFELYDREPAIHETKGVQIRSAQGLIKFENVSFAYPTRPAVTIFKGLNFEIPSGSNVCIVGPSGGGKSTVGSLLLRFYSPTEGRITIDGQDLSGINAKSLRRKIGVVSQEPVLFSGTIAENIAYGKPDATHADIVLAARKANCNFISDLPDGLDTNVGARGSQLSGGQKQRIAIARALIKDPDILILDEATSALDAESETLVNEALAALLQGRNTTICIAHRLSTIKRSDTIIVLSSEGRVAEIGNYSLLAADPNSEFSRLMEWQLYGGELSHKQEARITETEEEEEEERREREEEEEEEEEDEEQYDNSEPKGEDNSQRNGKKRN